MEEGNDKNITNNITKNLGHNSLANCTVQTPLKWTKNGAKPSCRVEKSAKFGKGVLNIMVFKLKDTAPDP